MATSQLETKKNEARRKGQVAAATAVASVAALVALPAAPLVGVAGLGASAVLGYRWVKFRIKEGIRF